MQILLSYNSLYRSIKFNLPIIKCIASELIVKYKQSII